MQIKKDPQPQNRGWQLLEEGFSSVFSFINKRHVLEKNNVGQQRWLEVLSKRE